ncbi:protein kinase [Microbulbifer salipaludis]|uniref:Protein kinase n=1 Tax=Microbulbifer salipaludis TaxID=187980 RepID=A0ABS3E4T0_9GAMM|nr:serine/threonine-protein kinase [Microbulbifer salipaludis]MBN8430262.1 protein kinase [Microbulbifer salipaludis]
MDIADPEVTQHKAAPNTRIGSDRYRIRSTLGAGGMGVVYLADDLKLHRQVAIKKLKDDAASQNARDRIQQEARLLAQLNHPNIVALHDVLEDNGSVALVMEYIEGTTLRAWMRERSPSLQQKLSLLMQICLGLSEAHSLGIIHRDLKSDNILIAENAKGEPVAKITDFGIAKSQQLDEKTLTAENQLAGTITAMSPEQILGKTLDARSDLFSLGTIAFELLTGSRPFGKNDIGALAMANRVTNDPHTPPAQAWADIPEPLAILLDKLLAKDPAQRPESAQIVYQGFALLHKQGLETGSEDYTATLTDLFTQQKVKSRRRWQRALAGVAAAFVLGVGSYWGWKEITRLEPQYIAVMPVEINGEIRGEENAKALTRTMVRQALMNSVSQLKASALVSFTPEEGQDFDDQLQALRNKGVTDALVAQLECAQTRCEIALQRIGPADSQIKQQSSFAFLADKRQEAGYRIANSMAALFPQDYSNKTGKQVVMSDKDYNDYLNIAARLESKDNSVDDLNRLEKLLNSYPQNPTLYKAYTQVATDLFVLTGEETHIQSGLDMLRVAEGRGIDPSLTLELELWLRSYSTEKTQFDELLAKIDEQQTPSSELMAKYARFLYMQGDYEAGLHYAQEAAELNPSADNLYLIALNQIASGSYDDGRITLNETITAFPEHWSSYSALGVIELESGNLDAAEFAITSIPENLRGWRTMMNLGTAQFLMGNFSAALNEFEEVLKIVPDSVQAIEQTAEIHLALNDQTRATKKFSKVISLTENKDDAELKYYRSLALANSDRLDEALSLITQLLIESPEDTFVQYAAAQIYAMSGEWRSSNLYISKLLQQGMSAEWFKLPVLQRLCTQPQASLKVKSAICD